MSHDAHAMTPEEIRKHIRVYIMVFLSLAVLTVVTVSVSYLHLTPAIAITVALFIATIKAGLVASYFMHLISEKKLIFSILVLTGFFFLSMILIILASDRSKFVI